MTVFDDGPIDMEHLEKYIVGDIALRNEILGLFADQAALLTNQFDPAQTDENWQNTAHAMKGASRGIGAWHLGSLCEKAEKLTGDVINKTDNRLEILAAIKGQLLEVSEESNRLREQSLCA